MAATGLVLGLAVASPARAAFDPGVEASNFSKTEERQAIYDTPAYQARLRTQSNTNGTAALLAEAKDPEREFTSDLCWNGNDGCAGDVRLYDWEKNHNGIVEPVLFTARNGATLSGHIWATKSGPASRPGIVITNGSVQADEQMYWYAAQALAKAGYVVMTWDPQGQGQSDTRGATPDENEGFPAQTDGRPFFDGTEDAVNFFFSTAAHPYVPETSCSTGTSHAAKQARRVKAGLDAGYNPYSKLFDRKRLGLAGHSYGAAGVSYVGQLDPRVDAIVAWDNLSQARPGTGGGQGFPPGEQGCPAHPGERVDRTPALKAGHGKPALGMSADYFLPPTPNTKEPRSPAECAAIAKRYEQGTQPSEDEGTDCKALASLEYSAHGNDSGELVIRGGSHLDFSFIPNQAFGATLRGADMIDWYTTAWFDKFVKKDPSADRRLITNRWLADKPEAAVDPDHSGNMFSFYHRSRLDFHLNDGRRFDQEDLRSGKGLRADCDPASYSYLALATSPDKPRASRPCPSPRSSGAKTAARCVKAPGVARRTRFGMGRLGRTRTSERRSTKAKRVTRAGIDRYCVRGGGHVRLGFTRSRVRLVLTTSRKASVRGVKVGQSSRTLRRKLHGERRLKVGKRVWYVARGTKARLVYELTAKGRVAQEGIADLRFTHGTKAQRSFLRSFRL